MFYLAFPLQVLHSIEYLLNRGHVIIILNQTNASVVCGIHSNSKKYIKKHDIMSQIWEIALYNKLRQVNSSCFPYTGAGGLEATAANMTLLTKHLV